MFPSHCTNTYLKEHVRLYDICVPEFILHIGLSGCKRFEPELVHSGVGRPEFPSAYDAELLNIISAEGTANSCIVLLGALYGNGKSIEEGRLRQEAQLEDVVLSKD